jgi:hypothetical protein
MSDRPAHSRSLADVIDEALLHEELDEFDAMDPEVLRKELAAAGYDAEATRAAVVAARDQAYSEPPAASEPPVAQAPPAPPAKVVSLASAKKKREGFARLMPLAIAAGVALAADLGGYQYAASYRPPMTTNYPVYVGPPTPQQRALSRKERGLRLCTLGYYGECRDWLDEADKLDPDTEKDPRVKAARKSIAAEEQGESPEGMPEYNAKPPLGPGERPLQRSP